MTSASKCIRDFWRIAGRDNLGRVVVRCLIGGVRIAASLGFVWISKRLIDIATGNLSGELEPGIVLMVALMLLQMATNVAASYYEGLILVKSENELRARLFDHVMRSRWSGKEAYHSGDVTNRLETDVRSISELVCTRVPDIIVTLCQLFCASAFLFVMAPGLLWLLLSIIVIGVVSSRVFFRKIRHLSELIREEDAKIQSFMQENLLHRLLALTMIGVGRISDSMLELQLNLRKDSEKRLSMNAVARLCMSLGFGAGYLSAFLWGVFGIRSGSVTFGMMTAFLQLVGQVQGPVAQLARYIPAVIHSMASVDRLAELDGMELEPQEEEIRFSGKPSVEVNGVSYSYPDGTVVLNDFSCRFEAGKMTAVVGPTGIGKSTLIKLILALLEPQKGEITISDAERSSAVGPGTRCNFMYVPQGNSLMSGSIRHNFLLARPDATQAEMEDALKLACAEFVLDLPDGLDTVCTELGAGLSEGQAQRIAIARALLHRGSVLVLDESTSALDPATEERILDGMKRSFANQRTVIFITHRKSVAEWADDVISVSN